MVRVRNLVLAIAATTALTSNMAFALGLGEVRLQSSLNQPLSAEIELLDARNLGAGEVVPSLASIEDFNRVGVDRPYFLSDLIFTPVKRPDGRYVIQVSSSKPIREPYLNFVIEVMWPSGRLLREYTLLLDPPLYSPETVAQAAPQLPIAAPAPRAVAAPAPAAAAAPAPAARPAAAPGARAPLGDEYRVTPRDTLWEIADRARHGGTVHQAMLAIQDLNPDAFIDGNINRMKNGQVLRLPTAEQVAQRSRADAVALVAEQNAAWRQGRAVSPSGARQLDATPRTTVSAEPARSDSGDNLRLVAGSTGSSTAGSDTGVDGDSAALRDQLASARENLDSTVRENAELKDRLEDLQSQLDKLQRLMQLKDDQLAKLQVQAGQEIPPAEVAPAAEDSELALAGEAEVESDDLLAEASPTVPEEASESADLLAAGPAAVAPVAQPEAPAEPAAPVAPVVSTPPAAPAPEAGLLSAIVNNPVWLGAGGGVLLLVLVGLLLRSRRNAAKEAEFDDELPESNPFAEQAAVAFAAQASVPDEQGGHDLPEAAETRRAAPAADVLAEADVYIAYGRFSQAAELLQNALNHEPQRSDLRLKLMEVRAEMNDQEGFAREEAELREIGGSERQIDELKVKYPAMVAGAAALAVGAGSAADEFDFNFDDLGLEQPLVEAEAGSDEAPVADFELNLDDLDEQLAALEGTVPVLEEQPEPEGPVPAASALESSEEEFSFDLPETEQEAETSVEDPFADFSLELPEEQPAAASPAVTEEPAAFLDFDFEPETAAVEAADETDSMELPLLATEEAVQPATVEEPEFESEFELPEDFDLSLDELGLDEDVPASVDAQLDDMDLELEALAKRFEQAGEPAVAEPTPAKASPVTDNMDDDFDFLDGTDETTTKLDLARAYIEMGDADGAKDILDEILAEGNDAQQQEARDMISAMS